MKLRASVILILLCFPALGWADVSIEATLIRDYAVPGGFEYGSASVAAGVDGKTLIASRRGDVMTSRCSVIVASDEGAQEFAYTFNDAPTLCSGIAAHPDGGFIVRGSDPSAIQGDVTGFTTYIDATGDEVWKVSDQALVDARAEPQGPGEFLGNYVTPLRPVIYSPILDKVLGFSIGSITVGFDEKFIGQAHVINSESGALTVNGQTFGQGGSGVAAGAVVRDDGDYILRYFVNGQQGAFFYNYDGRNTVSFFRPDGRDWDERWVWHMLYANSAVHLLWTETEDPTEPTRLMVTNNDGAPLYAVEFEAQYQFRSGENVGLGLPTNMWLTRDYTVIAHVVVGEIFLRFVDQNGVSPGVGYLNTAIPFAPLALVNGPNQSLRLLAVDELNQRFYEYDLTFEDVSAFDPDAGFGDVDIELDLGTGTLVDVLEEVGCGCESVARRAPMPAWFVLLGFGIVVIRRRARDVS